MRDLLAAKGEASRRLEEHIMESSKPYSRLTVRQLFYILVSRHGYPPNRRFYKLLVYHLVKLRRSHPDLYMKFVDTTRAFISPLNSFSEIELWVEKDSIRSFVEELAQKYKVSLQVERGFGSLSMFRDALIRARERGVKKILYLGDFDPSGLLIEAINVREMGIAFKRVALTLEQVQAYNPPARPVNLRDSRAPFYISRFGDRCWEVEALEPGILLNLVENKLRESVPAKFLEETMVSEKASKIAKRLTADLLERISMDACELVRRGFSDDEIVSRLSSKYGLRGV